MTSHQVPVVSVVLPAFNEADRIQQTIRHLLNQDFPHPYEIIVVDDGSTDGTGTEVRQFPQVRLIRQVNQGVAVARNTGFEAAKAGLIASTDADCRQPRWWLRKLYQQMIEDDRVVAVGGYAILDDETIAKFFTKLTRQAHALKLSKLLFGGQALSTQNLMVRKWAWQAVGGFNSRLTRPTDLDDVDLTLRLNAVGRVEACKEIYVLASARRVSRQHLKFIHTRLRAYLHYMRQKHSWREQQLN